MASIKGEHHVIGAVEHQGKRYVLRSIIIPARTVANDGRMNVLLSGGVHGDEPAGVQALLEFAEKYADSYAKKFRFFILPIVNPVGFEKNSLENGRLENINRKFVEATDCPEAKIVIEALKSWGVRFAFTIDMPLPNASA